MAVDDEDCGGGAGLGLRRMLVGLAAGKCAPPDCEPPAAAFSPRSPLDLSALDGPLLLSPRSPTIWDSRRVGLGAIVDDALGELGHAAGATTNRLLGHQMRLPSFKLSHILAKSSSNPMSCARAPPGLANAEVTAGGVPVPCSRSYGDLKSGPEPIVAPRGRGASSLSADHAAKVPGAPESLPGRWYVGSVSATEVEQSEDYTCIIAHGPNPKTTRLFGDCILEPITARVRDGDGMDVVEVKQAAAESYWLVKCSGEESEDSCMWCKEKTDANDGCVYRGGDALALCTGNCRDQEILVEEEEEEKSTPKSSFSPSVSSSSFSDDTFMGGMVVLTGPVDAQLP